MGESPDVRIGDYWYRLNEGQDETGLLGLHPMIRSWKSIFADRQGIPGDPGIQNVQADDLRWAQTSWSQGEGQRVIDPTSQPSFKTYERSQGIDLSVPGEMRLAKEMAQQGLTGAGATTLQGSAFVDDVGTSTVVDTTDRRLSVVADAIKKDTASLAAGGWQFDIYAYLDAPNTILGDALKEFAPNVELAALIANLTNVGADARTVYQTPPAGQVTLTWSLELFGPAGLDTLTWRIYVVDHTAGNTIVASHSTAHTFSTGAAGFPITDSITFTAVAGHQYQYHVKFMSKSPGGAYVLRAINVTQDPADVKTVTWQIKQASTVVASGVATLSSRTTAKIASTSIVSTGAVYTVRVAYTAGSSNPIVDKAVYTAVTLHDPRCLELGQGDKAWLVDYDPTPGVATALWWDPSNSIWSPVGTFGAAGSKAVAMAHSDNYEFVGMDDKIVYRIKAPATIAAYSAAATDALVGIAVGGNRLFVLTESTANGTSLFDTTLEGTPAVALTSRYPAANVGVVVDNDSPQRVAGTHNGAVFFANQGPDCWVYRWDGAIGAPLCKLPTGFRGSAIAYGNGLTWLAGNFPAADTDGTTRQRPALFSIDSNGTPSQIGVYLWRDDDPSTRIRAIQLYGTDLWLVAEVASSPKKLRLWRVSLVSFGAFLAQEIPTDETQAASMARGLAITYLDRITIWGKGNPYLQSSAYRTAGSSYLTSSRYTFSLTERKELIALDVAGLIPTGTSVEVWYSLDDGDFVHGATFTAPGRQAISAPGTGVFFQTLRVQTWLTSTDPALTPTVYSVMARCYLQTYDRSWDLLLRCFKESSVWHIGGGTVAGSVGIANIYDLAAQGGVVEFEDRYSSEAAVEAQVYAVSLGDPQAVYVRPGEAYVKVRVKEWAS